MLMIGLGKEPPAPERQPAAHRTPLRTSVTAPPNGAPPETHSSTPPPLCGLQFPFRFLLAKVQTPTPPLAGHHISGLLPQSN